VKGNILTVMKMEAISAFNKYAEQYNEWYHEKRGSLIFESEVKAIEALTLEGFGVEVGVGTGVFASRLGVPLGVDPALKMIKIAKKRGVNVVLALSEFLPIRSECLDYVLLIFTICFLRNPASSLKEAWRVLRYGGNIIIGFITRNSRWGKLYLEKKVEGHKLYKYANFYTIEEIKEMLEKEKFQIKGYTATLSQEPEMILHVEGPSSDVGRHGFVCIKAVKV
jgi:ubiquinone/menaquinone biosynthesis C-methylase UbiE